MDQIEQAQAKPRRRRRWLIVTVVLVLLASVSWWNWPRGDARFVGKWQLFGGSAYLKSFTPLGKLVFYSNGISDWPLQTDNRQIETYDWRVADDLLLIGDKSPTYLSTTAGKVLAWARSYRSGTFYFYFQSVNDYRILTASPDEILIEEVENRVRYLLRRIPE